MLSLEVLQETNWQHKNGSVYEVLMIANEQTAMPDVYPVTVVYRNIANGRIWSRPVSEWERSFKRLDTTI